ncbi:hypothetical protein [Agromyces sp. ZXT2-6]|uniref:hypothetical protein n=1 Tax=Agromyces sp. ZXT2-6 TaxID=3461153 RepID=UPI004054C3D5
MIILTLDEMPELPVAHARVHEVKAQPVSRVSVLSMLRRLMLIDRLADLEWNREQDWLIAGDQRVRVAMNARSGGIRYSLRALADEQGQNITSSVGRLEEIARDFLVRLGRPAGPTTMERVTHLHAQTSSPVGQLSEVATLDAGLIFRRTIDGIPAIGPGGRAMVRIGTDDVVVGGREVWRPIVRSGPPVDLVRPDTAVDMLQRRLEARGLDGEARVRSALFGYEERGIGERQQRLEPSYAFLIEFYGDNVDYRTAEVISALPALVA